MASYHLRDHVISLGNDGLLTTENTAFPSTADTVERIFHQEFPRVAAHWPQKRLLLYAHGGLVNEDVAVRALKGGLVRKLLNAQIYPVAIVWHTGFMTTVSNIIDDIWNDILRERSSPTLRGLTLGEAALAPIATPPQWWLIETAARLAKDAADALDRAFDWKDDLIEDRATIGRVFWDEMKQNAECATTRPDGGLRHVIDSIQRLPANQRPALHLAGHSAGSIILGYALKHASSDGLPFESCSLWAPACTLELAKESYLSALEEPGRLGKIQLQTLTPRAELDDNCMNIYGRSLLYLVSRTFESGASRKDPVPLLGMAHCVNSDGLCSSVFDSEKSPDNDWVQLGTAPQNARASHGMFDNDPRVIDRAISWMTA